MAQIEYDDEGGLSLYFFAAFWGLIIFPLAYFYWPRKPDRLTSTIPCKCKQCGQKNNRLSKLNPATSVFAWVKKLFFIVGFIVFGILVFQASQVEKDYVDYDPFTTLGVDRGASEAEIKRAYRKLTLKHHPDKEGGDEKLFMKISKAHAALTDPEARENWEKYGNPDGPTAATFGIALPAWIVEKENSIWVLGVYVACFMVILPTVVSMWWYKSNKTAGDRINTTTVSMYQKCLHDTPAMSVKMVMKILSSSFEFEKKHNPEMIFRESDEQEVRKVQRQLAAFQKDKTTAANKLFSYPHSVKARTILYAHLERFPLPADTLEVDRLYILKKIPMLLQEMITIFIQLLYMFLQRRVPNRVKLVSLENIIRLCQCIVQGVADNKSPLLQLPHLQEGQLKSLQIRKKDVKNLEQLARLSNRERENVLNFMEQQECQDVTTVLGMLPVLTLNVSVQVIDDKDEHEITAHSIVTVKCHIVRDSFRNVYFVADTDSDQMKNNSLVEVGAIDESAAPPAQNGTPRRSIQNRKGGKKPQKNNRKKKAPSATTGTEDKEKENGDDYDKEDAETGNSDSESKASEAKESAREGDSDSDDDLWKNAETNKRAKILESKPKTSHEVHCPYFPEIRQEGWWVYLCDPKNSLLKSPVEKLSGLKQEETVTLQFNAPEPGSYSYVVHVKSDSYIGLDVEKELKIKVLPAKIIEDHPHWNFSDEEEEGAKEEEEEAEVSDSDSEHLTSCSESGDEESDN